MIIKLINTYKYYHDFHIYIFRFPKFSTILSTINPFSLGLAWNDHTIPAYITEGPSYIIIALPTIYIPRWYSLLAGFTTQTQIKMIHPQPRNCCKYSIFLTIIFMYGTSNALVHLVRFILIIWIFKTKQNRDKHTNKQYIQLSL